ncbi:EST/SMG-like protein 1 [[Candida] jaroonii]|uniref:EST/SMG-like protein 1 n=1 Tax=[Candida] jaroonii TaxID=467808 RepID=A0ACA9Y564_9ASCO|nr:EST/SMG-like protein 1 [[Candida] jaroonii]
MSNLNDSKINIGNSQKRQNSLSNTLINNKRYNPINPESEYSRNSLIGQHLPSSSLHSGNSNSINLNNSINKISHNTSPNSISNHLGNSNLSKNSRFQNNQYSTSMMDNPSSNHPQSHQQIAQYNNSNLNRKGYNQSTTVFDKTPTPSSYEVPSSPNNNPIMTSIQNVSDSPDSNTEQSQSISQNPSQHPTSSRLSSEIKDSSINTEQSVSSKSTQPREMTEEEQQLATKLKETYKNIVNYEEIVQKNCLDITIKTNQITNNAQINNFNNNLSPNLNPQNSTILNNAKISELSNELWTVYHHNITLLDNYTDFLVTALKPSSNKTKDHFKTGKNIVDLYKIPRRMWVYGVVAFLEVLKNIINIFQDHEICSCFIGHCFTIISNLTDPILDMQGWWSEKLGDLSRMAIALYSSRFIDWKVSAEHWYSISMRTLYGHGKIYYHMCTVQQDNLDALVNIGKSVICRDPFVPTQQYLRLVVENICTQRNILSLLELPIIDFIKIHKVLLSINSNQLNDQLQYGIDLVSRYGITFGSDSNGYNFFTRELYTPNGITNTNDPHTPFYLSHQQNGVNSIEKLNFWLNKGPLFAISNINHIIGLGDAKNPFGKLFLLPEALKERKDKKDRKRKSKSSITEDLPNLSPSNSLNGQTVLASELSTENWFYCLQFLNKSVLELSIRILKHYLVGPIEASYGHVIIWLYFLISIGEATNKNPKSKKMMYWLFQKIFPWESMINYLNTILEIIKSNSQLNNKCYEILNNYSNYIQFFNENETLSEVWRCWGTLWFDFISLKTDYSDFETAGIVDYNIFDLPVSGINSNFKNDIKQSFDENNHRLIRIILLARFIADNYEFGLLRNFDGFKFNQNFINNLNDDPVSSDINLQIEDFLYGDNRFISHNFFENINWDNLINPEITNSLDKFNIDKNWFKESTDFSIIGNDDIIKNDNFNQQINDTNLDKDSIEFYQSMVNSENLSLMNDNDLITGDLGDNMDSKLTYITLDTNIWLKHCGRIFKCIRNKVFKISIPLIVFQELRSLRKSAEATIADAATRSVIIIRELYSAKEILPLRFDGTIASDINETTEFENNSNWRAGVDETILNSVNLQNELSKNILRGLNSTIDNLVLDSKLSKSFRYCILITDDRNMRLRAKTMGVTSFQSKWLFTQLEGTFYDKCID